MRFYTFFLCSFLQTIVCFAQSGYPKNYFDSPVKIPLSLAGNFGEIRPNHFHSGFDIRTNGKEGLPVFAVADGFVSRIRISPVGYGKAIYITHPNGYVSVYAHLRSFNTLIQSKAKEMQYAIQSFELDTLLKKELLPVKKGELIGYSGNTGSSQAPHLHFEIRDELSERPVNPYFFGFRVTDQIAPVISSIFIYPLHPGATINKIHKEKKINITGINGNYHVTQPEHLILKGPIGFGITCFDRENNSSGVNNVFSIEMIVDEKRWFYCELDSISFNYSRYVNTHIDYAQKQKTKQIIQKCYLSKNNPLGIYKKAEQKGFVTFSDTLEHIIKFTVKDYAGNAATLNLKVKGDIASHTIAVPNKNTFDCFRNNIFSNKEVEMYLPAYSLYDDLEWNYKKLPAGKGMLSAVYQFADDGVALQKAVTLKINASHLHQSIKEKAGIVSIDKSGKWSYEGGTAYNDTIITNVMHLGKFALAIDTIAPKIHPNVKILPATSVQEFQHVNKLQFILSDNLSGIQKFNAAIDGKWVLGEYDKKSGTLVYQLNDLITDHLSHHFQLEVYDNSNNKTVWKVVFKR